jgi:hypothetical protein
MLLFAPSDEVVAEAFWGFVPPRRTAETISGVLVSRGKTGFESARIYMCRDDRKSSLVLSSLLGCLPGRLLSSSCTSPTLGEWSDPRVAPATSSVVRRHPAARL